ncbi:TonB-dependent receptor [Arthrospiribacter ruber]|uniref:TonB-dependent receptor n=1 Tax=Arthrospiribacter ruber TaxID=2487934 RepID=A0A951IU44_9BACT|nr:carboxypeptidase-like regulatory domain-containing protein [Arthrospiribacter ruber]MBW3467143.1 TonB-dependent receptor [Arthrospiribacter ruber]
MKLKAFLILMFLGFAWQECLSQTTPQKFTGMYPGISFQRFSRQIEQQSDYRFYFLEQDIAEIEVNISASDNTLDQMLQAIFDGTALKYTIDEKKKVFVTRDKKLDLSLRPDFFTYVSTDESDSIGRQQDIQREFSRNKLYVIGNPSPQKEAVLRGKVTGLDTGNPVFGAVIFERVNYTRAIANEEGEYAITLPVGRHTLFIQNLGGFIEQRQISLQSDGILDIAIEENIISLDEVTISSEKMSNIARPEMGVQSLNIQSMKKLPAVLGEVDVIRSILTLPGVQTVGEASVGFNVRGGAADQNLILMNHATIYNPSHLFGLFSAFNPDMVESVELYKAGIPVQYGGRLSSVLEVNSKYGNSEKVKVAGGIGLMTSRLTVEGPIGENTTFILGGRSTYSDWILNILEENTDFSDARAAFYDLNFSMSHKLNEKNILRFNAYNSRDNFRFDRDTTFFYENRNINLSWTHYLNEQTEAELVVGSDFYSFDIEGRDNPSNAYDFGYNIRQEFAKINVRYELNEEHKLNFGIHSIRYRLQPGRLGPSGPESIVMEERVNQEQALETSFFLGDNYEVDDRLTVNYGVRYALYHYLGPNTVREYREGAPLSPPNLISERNVAAGNIINTYHGPEFRVSARYILDNISSIKAGYNTGRQFIHLITNNAAIAPTDIWKLSDPNIRPQWGDQLSIGYYRNLKIDKFEFSVEAYHRTLRNLIDFSSGATLVLNNAVEQDVLKTDGRAYGAEILLKKNTGKLNGWVSYTYARSLLRTAEDEPGEKINDGNWYPSNFDQPHNAVLVGNYEWSKRFSTSINANYSTGRPITLPVAQFLYGGSQRVYFSDRNAYRIPDYFRIDLSVNIEGNHKVRKLAHSSWSVGVYNLLGRRNPYSVFFTPINGTLEGFQLSIFAQPIPFITYNFRI